MRNTFLRHDPSRTAPSPNTRPLSALRSLEERPAAVPRNKQPRWASQKIDRDRCIDACIHRLARGASMRPIRRSSLAQVGRQFLCSKAGAVRLRCRWRNEIMNAEFWALRPVRDLCCICRAPDVVLTKRPRTRAAAQSVLAARDRAAAGSGAAGLTLFAKATSSSLPLALPSALLSKS